MVIIASHGKAQVKLVPCAPDMGLQRPGAQAGPSDDLVVAAFRAMVDQVVGEMMGL